MDTLITTLTPVERLQLANQFEILEKLNPEQAEIYAARRDIVEHGYSIQYDDVFSDIFDEMPYEECKYVYDVLDMHRVLINSLNALKDKQGLTLDDVKFEGFDGNNESKRHAFAKHLKDEGKWTETLVGSLNSHSQSTISRYPKMLKKFDKIVETLDKTGPGGWDLTAEQIREIIS
jgi:uncharacterized protein YfbU (UPF0304 family)